MGRPTTYKVEYCARAVELGELGHSKAEIAADLCGGSYQQLDSWAKANPEFHEALARARTLALAFFERMGRENAHKRDFNSNLYRVVVSGRFAEYRDKQTVEVHAAPAEIDVAQLSPEERSALAHLLGKAKRQPAGPEAGPDAGSSRPKLLIDNTNSG